MKDWRVDLLENVSDTHGMLFEPKNFIAQSSSDHIHCSICFKTICGGNSVYNNSGFYCKESGDWLCKQCFNDFKDQFDWKLK